MIRLERYQEVRPGTFRYLIPVHGLSGVSRQPILDACRQLNRMGVDTSERVGRFRKGRTEPDISCSVRWGADHTVDETVTRSPRFIKYREFKRWEGGL